MVRSDEGETGAIAALQVDDQRFGADLGGPPRIGLMETQSPHGRLGVVDPGRRRSMMYPHRRSSGPAPARVNNSKPSVGRLGLHKPDPWGSTKVSTKPLVVNV